MHHCTVSDSSAEATKSSVFLPEHRFRFYWELACTLGTLYYAIAIPVLVVQEEDCMRLASTEASACYKQWHWILAIGYTIDVFFFADAAVRSRFFAFKAIEDDREVLVSDPVSRTGPPDRSAVPIFSRAHTEENLCSVHGVC
jgi:hypothetical protein